MIPLSIEFIVALISNTHGLRSQKPRCENYPNIGHSIIYNLCDSWFRFTIFVETHILGAGFVFFLGVLGGEVWVAFGLGGGPLAS